MAQFTCLHGSVIDYIPKRTFHVNISFKIKITMKQIKIVVVSQKSLL